MVKFAKHLKLQLAEGSPQPAVFQEEDLSVFTTYKQKGAKTQLNSNIKNFTPIYKAKMMQIL